jgi:hypothetical protein
MNPNKNQHFAQPRHTGRLLPHAHTSYPVLAFLLLMVGVLLVGFNGLVNAYTITDSGTYTVKTIVSGPPPTTAASIDTPNNETQVTAQPITVTGSCPPQTYVKLYRNKFFSGVAECSASGQWTITTALFAGVNQLEADDYNFADEPGPVGTIMTVYYAAPALLPTQSTPTSTASTASGKSTHAVTGSGSSKTATSKPGTTPALVGEPLLLKSEFVYQGIYTGENLTWQVSVEGGQAPYGISIDWGDGTQQVLSRSTAGIFQISHTYTKHGGYHGSYPIKISAGDAAGSQSFLQLLAIVNDRPVGAATKVSNGLSGPSFFSSVTVSHAMRYIWPTYGVTVLMLISFWLGERRELGYLRPYLRRHRTK